jgi:DNA-binding SARP family transcriptional activator
MNDPLTRGVPAGRGEWGAMPEQWRVELFGGVRARRGEVQLERFRSQKTAALLGYLAYYRRPHAREELAELFWPDQDPASSRHNLSVALHALRQQLEGDRLPAGSVLVAGRNSVHLDQGAVSSDVEQFHRALRAADEATREEDRARLLAEAVELYRGELMAGFYESWAFSEQQHLGIRFVQALRGLTALQERLGQPEKALQSALRAAAADPLAEELHREIMRLYVSCGEPGAALRQFRELSRILREELDAVPAAASQALARAAREALSSATAALPESLPSGGARDPAAPPATARPAAAGPTAVPAGAGRRVGAPAHAPIGAMPLGSAFYVERPVDAALREAAAAPHPAAVTLVLLKGSRQTGKSSLLIRGLRAAKEAGCRTVLTDLEALDAAAMATPDSFLRALAVELAFQLEGEESDPEGPDAAWKPTLGPSVNFRTFLRRRIGAGEGRLVWGIDSTDRLFSCDFRSEVFGLFRSWHNQAALDPDGPWARLTLVMAYASEAHLFITDPNQSPFNVGTRLELTDFTSEETADLHRRYQTPLNVDGDLPRFHALCEGHPFLIQSGLHLAAASGGEAFVERLARDVDSESSPFADHLRRLRALLARDPDLCEAVREVLRGRPCPSPESFYRLRSLGFLRGETAGAAALRCPLYDAYLSRHLLTEASEIVPR